MNYTRRPTRPDGLYYRESRKRRTGDRSGPRGFAGPILGVLGVAGGFAALWLLRG